MVVIYYHCNWNFLSLIWICLSVQLKYYVQTYFQVRLACESLDLDSPGPEENQKWRKSKFPAIFSSHTFGEGCSDRVAEAGLAFIM